MIKKLVKMIFSLVIICAICIVLLIFYIGGGIGYLQNAVVSKFYSSSPTISSISKNLGDFSALPKDYKLIKSLNALGVSALTAEVIQNKQKIIILNAGPFLNITKQDIKSNNIAAQLKNLTSIGPLQFINFDKLEIIKNSSFNISKQEIPYVKVDFGYLNNAKNNSEGIIGVIDLAGKNNLFISVSDSGKFKLEKVINFLKISNKPSNNL